MPETQSTRRLQWLLWILLVWVGVIFVRLVSLQVIHHDDLLRLAQQQQQRTSGDSGAARVHFRPHRPAAGEEPAGRIDVRQSAEDSRRGRGGGSAVARAGSGSRRSCIEKIADGASCAAAGSCGSSAKIAGGGSRAAAQPEAGLGGVSAGDAAFLSARHAGRPRSGVDGHGRSDDVVERGNGGHRSELRRRAGGPAGPDARVHRRQAESPTIPWSRASRSRARTSR